MHPLAVQMCLIRDSRLNGFRRSQKSVGKEKTKNSLPKKVPVFVLMSPKNLTAEMSEFVKRKALLSTENFFRSRPGPLTTNVPTVGDRRAFETLNRLYIQLVI